MGPAGFKSRANAFYWPSCTLTFCFLLFSPLISISGQVLCCWVLRTDRTEIDLARLTLATFKNNNTSIIILNFSYQISYCYAPTIRNVTKINDSRVIFCTAAMFTLLSSLNSTKLFFYLAYSAITGAPISAAILNAIYIYKSTSIYILKLGLKDLPLPLNGSFVSSENDITYLI